MKIEFSERAWAEYLYFQEHDPAVIAKLNAIIKDCSRSPFSGIGKPERLRGNLTGFWSRRITQEHRFIYRVEADRLLVAQLRSHYDQ